MYIYYKVYEVHYYILSLRTRFKLIKSFICIYKYKYDIHKYSQ